MCKIYDFVEGLGVKTIRAFVIKEYVEKAGIKKVVCFSCGNASHTLKEVGLDVIDISPNGIFTPNKWFTPEEVQATFPGCFDATSGHLPLFLMQRIAEKIKFVLGEIDYKGIVRVPTGSGETILCLQMAYPDLELLAEYNRTPATLYDEQAPLNEIVKNFFLHTL